MAFFDTPTNSYVVKENLQTFSPEVTAAGLQYALKKQVVSLSTDLMSQTNAIFLLMVYF